LENYLKEFGEGKIKKSQNNYSEMNGNVNDTSTNIIVNSQSVPITPICSVKENGGGSQKIICG